MPTCANGHPVSDDAPVCGTCGLAVAPAQPATDWPVEALSWPGVDATTTGTPAYAPQPPYPYPYPPYGATAGPAPGWYPPLPYGQPYYPPPGGYYGPMPLGQQRGTNGLAIASMVLGIVWLYGLGSILALVFGYVSRRQIKRSGQGGGGMGLAGIILGWVGLAGMAAFIAVIAVAVNYFPNTTIDGTSVADYIESQYSANLVTCPSEPAITGNTFTCSDSTGQNYLVTITSDTGDYTVQRQ